MCFIAWNKILMGKGKNNTRSWRTSFWIFFLPYHSFLHFAPAIENGFHCPGILCSLGTWHIFTISSGKGLAQRFNVFSVEASSVSRSPSPRPRKLHHFILHHCFVFYITFVFFINYYNIYIKFYIILYNKNVI